MSGRSVWTMSGDGRALPALPALSAVSVAGLRLQNRAPRRIVWFSMWLVAVALVLVVALSVYEVALDIGGGMLAYMINSARSSFGSSSMDRCVGCFSHLYALQSPERATPFVSGHHAMLVAHRGGAGDRFVENTLPAFRWGNRTTQFMELDVDLSSDGQVVLWHDETLGRLLKTSDAKAAFGNRRACELSARELQALELVGESASRPATLKELLNEFELLKAVPGSAPLAVYMVDFKSCVPSEPTTPGTDVDARSHHDAACPSCERLIQATLDELSNAHVPLARVVFSTKEPFVTRRVKEVAEERGLGPALATLSCDLRHAWYSRRRLMQRLDDARADGVSAYYLFALRRPRLLRSVYEQRGGPVFVWTVDRAEDVYSLLRAGFGAIITNTPAQLEPFMKRWIAGDVAG